MKITKTEVKLLNYMNRQLSLLVVLAVTVLGIGLRISLRDIVSGDAATFLLPWYRQIQSAGGLLALDTQVGNYNLAYQTLIALMTYLPMEPLHAYKLLSCLFDYGLAITAAVLLFHLAPKHKDLAAILGYCLVLLDPLVWLNSAAWAQCDAIYTFFLLAAFAYACRDRMLAGFLCLGFAFAFKLQAIFALPFFLALWFQRRDFSLLHFLWIPGVMLLCGLPAIILGRNPLDAFTVYFGQVSTYPQLFLNYPSFWVLLDGLCQGSYYEALQAAAIFLTLSILILWIWLWLRHPENSRGIQLLYLFFILNYTCIFFLPAMHERYGFAYEMAAILLAVLDRRNWGLAAVLTGLSTITYAKFLFGWQALSMPVLALGNCGVYLLFSLKIAALFLQTGRTASCKTEAAVLQ